MKKALWKLPVLFGVRESSLLLLVRVSGSVARSMKVFVGASNDLQVRLTWKYSTVDTLVSSV